MRIRCRHVLTAAISEHIAHADPLAERAPCGQVVGDADVPGHGRAPLARACI